ncbi:MAG: protein translocase subunit SecD [Gaiellaceae bacterium MAG52_C11]|nr:protein translocase subunit SecD [Candidatus Gaiellasilicea maunaloa]
MNRRPHLILVALIVAGLIGVGLLAVPGSPFEKEATLGLDLQGGLEVTLQAVPPKNRPLQDSDLDRSVEILRDRIDKLGVAEPDIRKQGDNQIVVDYPGVEDPERVLEIIGQTAQLELFDLEANLVRPSVNAQLFPVATESIFALLSGQQSLVEGGTTDTWYLFDETKKVVAGPAATRNALLQSDAVGEEGKKGELPKGWRTFGVPPNTVVVECGIGEVVCPGVAGESPQQNSYYLFKFDRSQAAIDAGTAVPEMTGEDLRLSGTRQDFDTQSGQPIVTMQFTDSGGDKFGDITALEAQRGRRQFNLIGGGQGDYRDFVQHFAIVLDRQIKSWPSIDFRDNPNGIRGNAAQITGIGELGEAQDIALVLQTGALPVTFQTLESTTISASLGQDSLAEARLAAIAGLLVVAFFLLVFYRVLGIVAVLGLGIYAAFLYAAILVFNVTLTLPGFAGIILTLGVAADANVVIFERVKEEYRAGKSVRAAIAAGYGKGFATIVDANVVTAITAIVLFLVATAGVKGFALMLLIGTIMSLLTAVAATRAILGLLAGFKWFDNPRLMGAEGEPPKWIRRDFVGLRNRWFAISGVVLLLSLGAIVLNGLNLGIDFEGGTKVTFTTPQPVALEDVRSAAVDLDLGSAQIQGRGTVAPGDSYGEFQLQTESLEQAEQTRLTEALNDRFEADSSVQTVSASFGRQIAEGAIFAILASLLLIVIYISLRFQPKFSGPVIISLIHDVLITVGIYALLGREVTTATVAAVLTVLGYSIYDTIIIFDRIRENIPLMKRTSFRVMTNVSLWETIPRSLATTFITLLPITTLYFFGGETLKDFAFALLVGIGAGAYSSIFIAAPLVALLKEREPEYARRRDDTELRDASAVGRLFDEAESLAAAEPTPELIPVATPGDDEPSAPRVSNDAKRERRRQRRKTRPHGRAR